MHNNQYFWPKAYVTKDKKYKVTTGASTGVNKELQAGHKELQAGFTYMEAKDFEVSTAVMLLMRSII
jgi:hypothetical protein